MTATRITRLPALIAAAALAACASTPTPPTWQPEAPDTAASYSRYTGAGPGTLDGQAFLMRKDGVAVRAAGRTVTLDPATPLGNEWWGKAGKHWHFRTLTPPSAPFHAGRRSTTADADGRFKFASIPAGKYYVRTEITWEVGGYFPLQGGIVGRLVEVQPTGMTSVILNEFAN